MWPFKRKEWEKLGWAWTGTAVRTELQTRLSPAAIYLRDKDYRAISHKDFEQLLFDGWFPHDEPAYKSEIYDCDDFTVACMAAIHLRWAKVSRGKEALAFGYISANVKDMGYHAFIWHMDDKGDVAFYEPQTGLRANYTLLSVTLMES